MPQVPQPKNAQNPLTSRSAVLEKVPPAVREQVDQALISHDPPTYKAVFSKFDLAARNVSFTAFYYYGRQVRYQATLLVRARIAQQVQDSVTPIHAGHEAGQPSAGQPSPLAIARGQPPAPALATADLDLVAPSLVNRRSVIAPDQETTALVVHALGRHLLMLLEDDGPKADRVTRLSNAWRGAVWAQLAQGKFRDQLDARSRAVQSATVKRVLEDNQALLDAGYAEALERRQAAQEQAAFEQSHEESPERAVPADPSNPGLGTMGEAYDDYVRNYRPHPDFPFRTFEEFARMMAEHFAKRDVAARQPPEPNTAIP